jgi:hypothetical protein
MTEHGAFPQRVEQQRPVRHGRGVQMALAAGGLAWNLARRIYALALIWVVLWLSWKAFFYLLAALILPAEPPPQIVDLPTRLDEKILARAGGSFAGIQATENPRVPLSHYHRLETWYQPEPLNGCTQAGCHAPLPHGKNRADRAFLNMHATSLHCGVCHERSEQEPLQLVWYDLRNGEPAGPPALLGAYEWLTSRSLEEEERFTKEDQRRIVSLLHAASDESDGDPVLEHLAAHLAAVSVKGSEFTRLLGLARNTVPRHFRGEYGAKLALADPASGKPLLGNSRGDPAVVDYLAKRDRLSDEEGKRLLEKVHPTKRDRTLECSRCHTLEGSLVDLAAAGYPEARRRAIVQPIVMEAVENMKAGRPFHIPTFLGAEPEAGAREAGPDDAAGKELESGDR